MVHVRVCGLYFYTYLGEFAGESPNIDFFNMEIFSPLYGVLQSDSISLSPIAVQLVRLPFFCSVTVPSVSDDTYVFETLSWIIMAIKLELFDTKLTRK